MKKQWLLFFGIITAVVIGFKACVRVVDESFPPGYLPGEIDRESYASTGFQDYTIYRKYTYKDTKRLRKKLENNRYFVPVTENDIQYILSFFNDFEGWVEGEDFASQYDFNKACIGAGDYFFVEEAETYGGYTGFEGHYCNYDVYYFDIESMTLHFIHNNT